MTAATHSDIKTTIVDLRMLSFRVDDQHARRLLVSIEIGLNNVRILNKVSESVLTTAQRAVTLIKNKLDTSLGIIDRADINTLHDIDQSLWSIFNHLYNTEAEE